MQTRASGVIACRRSYLAVYTTLWRPLPICLSAPSKSSALACRVKLASTAASNSVTHLMRLQATMRATTELRADFQELVTIDPLLRMFPRFLEDFTAPP